MAFVQYIFTSVLIKELTAQNAYDTSLMSAKVCEKFGVTGRGFANRQKALAITEGEEASVKRYYQAVVADPMAGKVLLHVTRPIAAREFTDFSIWLNLGQGFQSNRYVCHLTEDTLPLAWPPKLSAKIRIMADAYLDPEMLAA